MVFVLDYNNYSNSGIEFLRSVHFLNQLNSTLKRHSMYDINMGSSSSRGDDNIVVYPNDPALIIEPFLYLGSAYAASNPKVLQYYGITHVSDYTLPDDPHMHSEV